MIRKLIVLLYLPIFIVLLAVSVGFVWNLVTSDERWNKMSPGLKSEVESLCKDPVSRIVWRGLALEQAKWMTEYLEFSASAQKLQEILQQWESKNLVMQAELNELNLRVRRQDEKIRTLERDRRSDPGVSSPASSGLGPVSKPVSTYFQLNTNDPAEVRRRTQSEAARQKAADEEMKRRQAAETARRIAAEVEEARRTEG